MGVRWTKEQQKVIDLRGGSLLVSAAAGSGKTAVLVERIISMITKGDHPLDIDRLLVVTFTKAAAAEMRERVGNAIGKALKKKPHDPHLQRQLTLVHNAKITTIDSFCVDVIRSHFHEIDLEPGFRIGDEGEMKLMREDVCGEVLESFYASGDPAFLKFADSYAGAKNDAYLREMILQLYDYSVSYPWPKEWLAGCAVQYDADTVQDLESKPWVAGFLDDLSVRIRDLIRRHERLYEITQEEDGPAMYAASIQDDLRQLRDLSSCAHLEDWRQRLSDIKFQMIGKAGNYKGSEEKKQAVMSGRNRMKDQITDLQNKYFSADLSEQISRMKKTGGMVKTLVEITLAFAEQFAAQKAKKNVLDFSDVEHCALAVLVDEETKEPTAAAAEYREQFAEIMIDEYQDINYVQETILTAVSGVASGRENLFMVGDVKQSIYRFRLARPELFMEKYHSFSPEEGSRQRVDLHKNFRSRREAIDLVNEVFFHIMGSDLGNVEYDSEAALYAGTDFPEYPHPGCCEPELIAVSGNKTGEEKKEAEARAAAQRIRELVEGQEIPGIRYRDITILLRSLSGWAESYQRVFEQEGIPLMVASRTGYFSAPEVQTVLSMLRVIDNPNQDIPLTAVMSSPIGGFSSKELALIRALIPDCAFYRCVKDFAKTDCSGVILEKTGGEGPEYERLLSETARLQQKTEKFREMVEEYRQRTPYTPVHQLLQEILDETGYRNYVTALPAGEQRRANLEMLVEKAIAYEETSYHGLFHFVRYIDRLLTYEVDYGEAEIVSEQEDAVRMMSIHMSKGLEFPVVFVAGMGKQFNMQDTRSPVIFHPDYGIGLRWFDSEKRTKSDTLIRRIFALETRKENLGEELRVLYVALTRAKEKLILIGSRKNKETEEPVLKAEEKLDFSRRMDAVCYWDWVLPALEGSGKYAVRVLNPEEELAGKLERSMTLQEQKRQVLAALEETDAAEDEIYEQISGQLSWTYPYEGREIRKQKVSVSELKHRAMEEAEAQFSETENASLFPQEIPVPYVPKFVDAGQENIGALRGTALHRFLECVDFSSLPDFSAQEESEAYVRAQIADLCGGRMEEQEAKLLDVSGIARFLQSETADRMRKSARQGRLTKEKPFVMSLPAREVWPDADSEENVLVQGIIDVFWEEDDGIVLLDYKTDRVESAEELTARYEKQLLLYAKALRRNFPQKEIKDVLIFSFRLRQVISLKRIEEKMDQEKADPQEKAETVSNRKMDSGLENGMKKKIILASASPRRRELLGKMGLEFEVVPAAGEEIMTKTDPSGAVMELAAQKAREVARQFGAGTLIIGADTVVVKDGQILGKPADEEDAVRMLTLLAGEVHQVYTGVCLIDIEENKANERTFYEATDVEFYPMSEAEIRAYAATGEPLDKAGAYGIQGKCAVFIKGIRGDYNNVVGLPAARLYHELLPVRGLFPAGENMF